MSVHDPHACWQRLVPVEDGNFRTRPFLFFSALAVVGLFLAALRMVGPLGRFSGMNDAYAWGLWKAFNVMTLTAIGSGGLAVGMAAWFFGRERLHAALRTAIVTSLLFYFTGMIALCVDVGRPWNMWQLLLPWMWNGHSALLEVAVCMPAYAFLFLLFESVPLVLERYERIGSARTRERIRSWMPGIRKVYPYMIAGAYLLPLLHQSSLGGLMLLSGPKLHPLWQTEFLPLLYVMAAGICGFAFVNGTLLISCLRFRRRVDIPVVAEIGSLMSWLALAWLAVRFADLGLRGRLGLALSGDRYALAFLAENLLLLVPAAVLRVRRMRETPRTLLVAGGVAGVGGLLYRFVPTLIAFNPGDHYGYFPSLAEVLITIGFIAFGIVAWEVAVRRFAILPGTAGDERPRALRQAPMPETNVSHRQGAPTWQE